MKKITDPRHEARCLALKALFEWSFNSVDPVEIVSRDAQYYAGMQTGNEDEAQVRVDRDLSLFIVKGVIDNLDAIDKIIKHSLLKYFNAIFALILYQHFGIRNFI